MFSHVLVSVGASIFLCA